MLHRRLALALSALALLAGLSIPGRAEQTFWTEKTGALPSPGAGATAYPVDLNYVYYPCQSYGRSNGCLCAPNQQSGVYGNGSAGCRAYNGHRPHRVSPPFPSTPPRYYPQRPPVPSPPSARPGRA